MIVDLGGAFVTEGGVATVTATRRGPTRKSATVRFSTVDGTAIANVDYVPRTDLITFPPGSTKQTFTIGTLDNSLAQGRKDLSIRLSDPSPGLLIGANNRPVIIDDDDDGGAIQFLQPAYSVNEGGTAVLTITRAGVKLASNVSIDYQVVGGTATSGIDFSLAPGTLTFGAGQGTQSISVSTGRTIAAGPKTVVVRLGSPGQGSRLMRRSRTTLTIVDDEQGGHPLPDGVQADGGDRHAEPAGDPDGKNLGATSAWTSGSASLSTAVAGLDFAPPGTLTFGPGQTTQVIPSRSSTTPDRQKVLWSSWSFRGAATLPEGSASAIITVTATRGEIQFSATTFRGRGQVAPLQITRADPPQHRDRAPPRPTARRWRRRRLGRRPLATSGTLTFLPGSTSQLLLIQTLQDAAGENDETFFVDLSLPAPSTAVIGPRNRATITILDDEQTVRFSTTGFGVNEGGVATIVVQRSGPTNTLTLVSYAISNGTAAAGTDYLAAATGTLTFTPGATSASFAVSTPARPRPTAPARNLAHRRQRDHLPTDPGVHHAAGQRAVHLHDEAGRAINSADRSPFSEKPPIIKGLAPGLALTLRGRTWPAT
jgi:hypothetical protein